jgi:flagellar motor switch protein FliM
MECNPAISHKIIAHLLGNGDSSLTDSTEKELTEIELEVFDHFYQLIVKQLKIAWDEVQAINLKTESMDTNANAIQIISDHEIVLLVVFEITIDDESGFLSICYPISYIESLLDVIVEKVFAEAKHKKVSKQKDINALISGSKMKIDVMLAETELNGKEILNLRAGDIIEFSKNATSSTTKVYINNKEKWSAVAGASSNRKAIQIMSNIDHEKMETLASLKSFHEEREDQVTKANDAIAKLISARDDF